MASRRDEGQVILLAGILLTMAFILFSIQLGVLTNLGQQVGRETENPLLEDYLLVRRTFETLVVDETRDYGGGGVVRCPDASEYGARLRSHVDHLVRLEMNRGHFLIVDALGLQLVEDPDPNIDQVRVSLTFYISDTTTSAADSILYEFDCRGSVAGSECVLELCVDL